MFTFFKTELSRTRDDAKAWIALGRKVWNYRRDVLPESAAGELRAQIESLAASVKAERDVAKLKLGIESLERVLARTGGVYYPRSGWQDNLEFLLYAAMFVIALRVFIAQPFKIPTNSMWPSYFGMTGDVFSSKEDEPSLHMQAVRLAAYGARPRRVEAPVDGKVWIPVGVRPESAAQADGSGVRVVLQNDKVSGRDWFVFPSRHARWPLRIGSKVVSVRTPAEFEGEMSRVYHDAFFPSSPSLEAGVLAALAAGRAEPAAQGHSVRAGAGLFWIETEKTVRAGENALAFDILGGDQLFVDRISYHFVRPTPGDAFVFRTKDIPKINADQYYIKRLVGVPGDTLEVRAPVLFRNGKPITGSVAFEYNAKLENAYSGYTNFWDLAPGRTVTLAPDTYYAMGDNSPQSSDSRYFGTVPAQAAIGRPLFIYYPLSKRWLRAP